MASFSYFSNILERELLLFFLGGGGVLLFFHMYRSQFSPTYKLRVLFVMISKTTTHICRIKGCGGI